MRAVRSTYHYTTSILLYLIVAQNQIGDRTSPPHSSHTATAHHNTILAHEHGKKTSGTFKFLPSGHGDLLELVSRRFDTHTPIKLSTMARNRERPSAPAIDQHFCRLR